MQRAMIISCRRFGTDRLSRNVGKELLHAALIVQKSVSYHLLRGGSLKSRNAPALLRQVVAAMNNTERMNTSVDKMPSRWVLKQVADIVTTVLTAEIHRRCLEPTYTTDVKLTHTECKVTTAVTSQPNLYKQTNKHTNKQTNNLERCSIYPSDVIPLTPPPFPKTPCDKSSLQHNPSGTNGTYTPPIAACDTTRYTGTISPPLSTHPLHTSPPIQ